MTSRRDPSRSAELSRLRLLQLSSPAFPIGAFAYSQGLEQAAERGWISDVPTLEQWLEGVLTRPFAHTDLPLVAHATRAWQAADPAFEVARLSATVFALRETKELRAEEQHLGSALSRVLARLGLAEARPFIGHPRASYVLLYGLAVARWELPLGEALSAYAFSWLENQIAAASRVIALGQLDAQALLSRLLVHLPELAERALSIPEQELGLTVPAFALASSWHEEQYCRLFRS